MNNSSEEIAEEIIQEYPPSVISKKERWGRVAIKSMMQAHTNQTLQELKAKVEEREEKLDEKISKLKLSANPDDWILANGIEQVKMGVHSVITLIDEVINEQ